MSENDYPEWELKPRRLNYEEMENPLLAIHDFFSYGHLPEIRQHLWEMLKAMVTGNYCNLLTRRERSNLIYFYEQLEKLVEAAHVIHKNNPAEPFSSPQAE